MKQRTNAEVIIPCTKQLKGKSISLPRFLDMVYVEFKKDGRAPTDGSILRCLRSLRNREIISYQNVKKMTGNGCVHSTYIFE